MALGKHLVQARPFVYALQCQTGKVNSNNNFIAKRLTTVYSSRSPYTWVNKLILIVGFKFFGLLFDHLFVARPMSLEALTV